MESLECKLSKWKKENPELLFNISIDSVKARNGRKFLNTCIYYGDNWANLGLIR